MEAVGHRYGRFYYFDQFNKITDPEGVVLWEARLNKPIQTDGPSARR